MTFLCAPGVDFNRYDVVDCSRSRFLQVWLSRAFQRSILTGMIFWGLQRSILAGMIFLSAPKVDSYRYNFFECSRSRFLQVWFSRTFQRSILTGMTFLSAPEVNSYRYDFLESVARYHPAVFCINDLRELHSPNPLPNCHPLPTAVPRWLLLSLIGQVDTKQKLKKNCAASWWTKTMTVLSLELWHGRLVSQTVARCPPLDPSGLVDTKNNVFVLLCCTGIWSGKSVVRCHPLSPLSPKSLARSFWRCVILVCCFLNMSLRSRGSRQIRYKCMFPWKVQKMFSLSNGKPRMCVLGVTALLH